MIKSQNSKKGEQMTLETTLETKIAKIESAVKELVTQQEKINKELERINNLHAEILAAIHMANAIMIKGEK